MGSISPADLYNFFDNKGIRHLYFSSTVKNSCSMITCNTLMSNRQLNFQKMPMSAPTNPDFEKGVRMWNKIPFYICDLHGYFTRQNKLGPVCFVININFLLDIHEKDLSISKRNPLNWKKGLTKNQVYYSSLDEYEEVFDTFMTERTAHKNIILLRDKKSTVNLSKYLTEIILDKSADRHLLFTKAQDELSNALKTANLTHIPLKIRECKNFCFCQSNYGGMSNEEIKKLFKP